MLNAALTGGAEQADGRTQLEALVDASEEVSSKEDVATMPSLRRSEEQELPDSGEPKMKEPSLRRSSQVAPANSR